MFSLNSISGSLRPSAKALRNPSSLVLFAPQIRRDLTFRFTSKAHFSNDADSSDCSDSHEVSESSVANFSGVQIEEIIDGCTGKQRIDTWVSSRISGISRARVQASIRSGLVSINGRIIDKVSHKVTKGDKISCRIAELQPLRAEPEDIPLDIVYEDEHVIVVNKPAHLVVHPAPGNATGTLVNGILNHCSLPTLSFPNELPEEGDEDNYLSDSDQSSVLGTFAGIQEKSVRPGIVHRLDKGTSGLLVVAKNEGSHACLAEQFKEHSIERVYISLTCGVPKPSSGRIDVPIGRDLNNRIRMVASSGSSKSGKTRHAASRYRVIEILAGGASALVEWRLETGRTHQIRAHAKYLGVPLLGDEIYGGTKSMALSLLQSRTPPAQHDKLRQLIYRLERPCLHAFTLGFRHPQMERKIKFSCQPPADFAEILTQLRDISMEKIP